MKNKSFWLAIFGALCGSAYAQSAVTIYGSFDGGVRHLTNANAAGDSVMTVGSIGTYNANRFGFKGVEDLGGGMNAHFTLESGFNTGTGGLDNATSTLFNRTSAVGIGGSWGSLDFGRQYTVAFKTIAGYETFTYQYPTIYLAVLATAGVRNNNDVQYVGNFGPVTVRAEYALGEQAGSTGDGSTQAIGLAYTEGPFKLGGAVTKKKSLVGTTYRDYRHYTFGGAYVTGPWRVNLGYADETQETGALDTRNKYLLSGLSYRFAPAFALTGGYHRIRNETAGATGQRQIYILSGVYSLSKRTDLYLATDRTKFDGTLIPATRQTSQAGISVGMNHNF